MYPMIFQLFSVSQKNRSFLQSGNKNKDQYTLLFSTFNIHNKNIIDTLFYYALFLLPVGLVFGEVPTSIAEIIIIVLWLLKDQWKHRLSLVKKNIYSWLLLSLYFIHIVGLFYTSDFDFALNDLRIKLPLLFFPLIFFSIDNISHRQIISLIKWTIIVVFINLSFLWINTPFRDSTFTDIRHASLFISHIRLGLISAFSILASAYLVIHHIPSSQKTVFIIISTMTFILMLSLGLMTGIITLLITTAFAILYMIIIKTNTWYFWLISGLSVLTSGALYFYIQHIQKKYFPENIKNTSLSHFTINKNPYFQDTSARYQENGYYVFSNIYDHELKKEWQKRSNTPYEAKDKKNNELKYTLYRYLTSKGLTKDSAGILQLNENDIRNIEYGIPNYLYAQANYLEKRIYELLQEYHYFKINNNPNGKTITLRIFYWKLAWNIWIKNFWFGVGTGDIKKAYHAEYHQYPYIDKSAQLRAHNQILTMAVTFGVPGLLIILFNIIYPLFALKNSNDYMLYYLLAIINTLSFLIDDTLETQPGVTFYAFFNTLLIKFCSFEKA